MYVFILMNALNYTLYSIFLKERLLGAKAYRISALLLEYCLKEKAEKRRRKLFNKYGDFYVSVSHFVRNLVRQAKKRKL